MAPSSAETRLDTREGTVAAEIRDLHAQLQQLDDVTGKLRVRLDELMVQRPTKEIGTPEEDDPVSRCKVAGEIHAAVGLAFNITAKVTDMLCCLDL